MNNYDFVGEFNQGVAIVIKDNLYGAVTIGGYEIIPPIYDYISPFNDGYAEAIQKGECKTLDLSGKEFKNTVPELKKDIKDNSLFATTEKYDSIERLNNGICIVSRDKKYGCINQIGSIIIPLKYESLVCQNKLLIAIRYDVTDESHKIGIINFQESEIVPFTHLTFCRQKIEFVIKPEIIFYKVIRWGAYSLQGKKNCEPIYDYIEYIADNLIKVGKDDVAYSAFDDYYWEDGERYDFTSSCKYSIVNWGLIDSTGKQILPLEYSSISDKAINGLVEICSDDRLGYVDITGHVVLKPTYKSIGDFADGYAVVSKDSCFYDENGCYKKRICFGVINNQFKEIIPCVFTSLEYEKKIGRFKTEVGYKTMDGRYVLEVDGKELLIDKKYKYCKPFNDTCAIVAYVSDEKEKYGLIDKKANIVLPPIFSRIDYIDNGMYKYKLNNLYGLVNSKGNIIVQNKYNYIGEFEDNLALMQIKLPYVNGKVLKLYGFIDSEGKEILTPSYEFVGKRNNNFYVVMKNNIWGLFDVEKRQLRIIPDVAFLGPCRDELCNINVGGNFNLNNMKITGGLWGYVSVNGQIIIKPIYEKAYLFSEGIAAVKYNGKWGFVNTKGEIVVPCEYDEFESSFKNGTGRLVKDGYIYVFDDSGMQIRHIEKRNDTEDYI